jgi:hypothetical protein
MTIISRKIGTILCYNQQRQYEFPPRSLVSKIRRRAERQEREISHKSQKKVSKKHVKLECVCRFVHLISFYSFRFRSFLNFVQSPSIFSIYVSAHDLCRCAFFFSSSIRILFYSSIVLRSEHFPSYFASFSMTYGISTSSSVSSSAVISKMTFFWWAGMGFLLMVSTRVDILFGERVC